MLTTDGGVIVCRISSNMPFLTCLIGFDINSCHMHYRYPFMAINQASIRLKLQSSPRYLAGYWQRGSLLYDHLGHLASLSALGLSFEGKF